MIRCLKRGVSAGQDAAEQSRVRQTVGSILADIERRGDAASAAHRLHHSGGRRPAVGLERERVALSRGRRSEWSGVLESFPVVRNGFPRESMGMRVRARGMIFISPGDAGSRRFSDRPTLLSYDFIDTRATPSRGP